MAIIKKSEFKQMNEPALLQHLTDLQKEMIKVRAQLSTHTTPENPGRIRSIKKTIARIKTRLHGMKLQQKQEQEAEKKNEKTKAAKALKAPKAAVDVATDAQNQKNAHKTSTKKGRIKKKQ